MSMRLFLIVLLVGAVVSGPARAADRIGIVFIGTADQVVQDASVWLKCFAYGPADQQSFMFNLPETKEKSMFEAADWPVHVATADQQSFMFNLPETKEKSMFKAADWPVHVATADQVVQGTSVWLSHFADGSADQQSFMPYISEWGRVR